MRRYCLIKLESVLFMLLALSSDSLAYIRDFKSLEASTMKTLALLRSRTARRRTTVVVVLVALCAALLPAVASRASGVFWLPTQEASDASFDHLNPVVATYHHHAYILSVRVNGTSATTSVFFSTNESGRWDTQLLSNQGPHNTYSGEFTSLAVDPTSGKLYAIWAYQKSPDADGVGVWTREPGGQWTGPTDVMTAGSLGEQPSIVAGGGKAYAAFVSSEVPGACDDATSRSGDVQVVSYDGGSWSPPRNLTSCVSDSSILEFSNPKLALDENGRPYLASSANGDLWFDENASGSWSDPAQITHGAAIPVSVGTALRTFYGIAASNGAAYVTYVRQSGTSTYDVQLMTHQLGASWSSPAHVSPPDSYGCPKFGVSVVANSGRVGVSYVRGHTGYCASSSGVSGNAPVVYTGAPGQMALVGSLAGATPDCFATSLANEGNLFRFVTTCDQPASVDQGQLYYKAEFLDTVGPVAHLVASARAKAPAIGLHWSARDPQPGSGVDYYQLQIRDGAGPWHTLQALTHAKQLIYRQARPGHRYTFRLRARDRTANWGAWVMSSTQAY